MKRRELIKLGSAAIGGISLAMLTGCDSDTNTVDNTVINENHNNTSDIIPK